MCEILRLNWRCGCGNIAKISFDIEDSLAKDLEKLAFKTNSSCTDLVKTFVQQGLDKQKGVDNMKEITISDEIIDGIIHRSKHLNCNPEKLINSILYDYLMKIEDVHSNVSGEKHNNAVVNDNPEGDDTLRKLRLLGNVGWD